MTRTNKVSGGIADKIISRLPIPKHRARTLRPEILFDDGLFNAEKELGLPVRMVFLALHTIADRKGLFSWDQSFTKFLMLDEQDSVKTCLDILHERGYLVHYRWQGLGYGAILGFTESQYLNPRESESTLPDPHAVGVEIIGANGEVIEVVAGRASKAKRAQPAQESEVETAKESDMDLVVEQPLEAIATGGDDNNAIEVVDVFDDVQQALDTSEAIEAELVEVSDKQSQLTLPVGIRFARMKLGGSTATMRIDPDNLFPVLPLNDKDISPRLEVAGLVPVIGGEGVWLTEARFAHFESIYPDGDNLTRLRVAIDWLMNNPAKRKTIAGLPRYFGSFLAGAQNSNQHLKRHGIAGDGALNNGYNPAHKADIKSAETAKMVGGLFAQKAKEQADRRGAH